MENEYQSKLVWTVTPIKPFARIYSVQYRKYFMLYKNVQNNFSYFTAVQTLL